MAIKIKKISIKNESDYLDILKRAKSDISEAFDVVIPILKDVEQNGDAAIRRYTEKFDKIALDNFKFERIENVKDKTKLIEREQYYLDTLLYAQEYIKDKDLRFLNLGYNINPTAGSQLGSKRGEETKKKIRIVFNLKKNFPKIKY
jgi:histidinol dehydrogenase